MAMQKIEKQEQPERCACGAKAVLVTYRGKKMVSCPNTLTCAMRSRFCKREEDAIKEWNVNVNAARNKRRTDNG